MNVWKIFSLLPYDIQNQIIELVEFERHQRLSKLVFKELAPIASMWRMKFVEERYEALYQEIPFHQYLSTYLPDPVNLLNGLQGCECCHRHAINTVSAKHVKEQTVLNKRFCICKCRSRIRYISWSLQSRMDLCAGG